VVDDFHGSEFVAHTPAALSRRSISQTRVFSRVEGREKGHAAELAGQPD